MSTLLAGRPLTHFTSGEDRAATEPAEARGLRRDGVRLMVATAAGIRHTAFHHLGDHLRAGDVLVVNTSATVPGQLDGTRAGSAVVVHLANRLSDGTRVVELRTAPDASAPVLDGQVGERISLPAGGVLELITAYPELRASGIARRRTEEEGAEAFFPLRATTTAADSRCSRRRSAGGDAGTTLFRSVSSDEDGGNPANIAASEASKQTERDARAARRQRPRGARPFGPATRSAAPKMRA
jgi:Queuosine biosynthesis protein